MIAWNDKKVNSNKKSAFLLFIVSNLMKIFFYQNMVQADVLVPMAGIEPAAVAL